MKVGQHWPEADLVTAARILTVRVGVLQPTAEAARHLFDVPLIRQHSLTHSRPHAPLRTTLEAGCELMPSLRRSCAVLELLRERESLGEL